MKKVSLQNITDTKVDEFFFVVQEVEPEVPETEAVDPELLQAQSTIERLARKYLVRPKIFYILTCMLHKY